MKRIIPHILLSIGALVSSGYALGQDTANNPNEYLFWVLVSVILGICLVCVVLSFTILALIYKPKEQAKSAEESAQPKPLVQEDGQDWWEKLKLSLTAAVPVAREADIDLGHEYDGIRELDNKLPPWWLYGFYVTIAAAVLYLFYFHIATDWSSDQEYQAEMAEGQKIKEAYLLKVANLVNEETVTPLSAQHEIGAGKEIYTQHCVACHGDQGQGGIGPNLTDAYWLHGGGIKNVFKTVKYGVIEKGMTPWQEILKPLEIQKVASYVLTLEGTDPPNPKAPQGEAWTPAPEAAEADTIPSISMNSPF